jgi:hypothetical protein
LEARALVRLSKDLLDERTCWLQRVHASMFQMGVPDLDISTVSDAGRDRIHPLRRPLCGIPSGDRRWPEPDDASGVGSDEIADLWVVVGGVCGLLPAKGADA